jgi:hypothetical protein
MRSQSSSRPHLALGSRLVIHRRAPPRRKLPPSSPASFTHQQYLVFTRTSHAQVLPRSIDSSRHERRSASASTTRLPHVPCSKCWVRSQTTSPRRSPRLELVVGAPVSEAGGGAYVVMARRDTWSRAARRKKTQQLRALRTGPQHCNGNQESGPEQVREGGRRSLRMCGWRSNAWWERAKGESGVQLVVQWKRGHDVQVFESFASHN